MIKLELLLLVLSSPLVLAAPQGAPQFIPASVAAITLDAANKAALKAANNPTSKSSTDLLTAADEGLIPVGIDQIKQVKPAGICNAVIGQNSITANTGAQLKKGGIGCSSTPMGQIPSVDQMVSSLIVSPEVGKDFDAGVDNQFSVQMNNVITGFFGNANSMYYLAPQLLNQGTIQGHCHVVAQKLSDNGAVLDPTFFQFFTGINTAAEPGTNVISAKIEAGSFVVPGLYRFCTITGSNTHQPMLSPILNRGPSDDCIRLKVVNTTGSVPVQAAGQKASAQSAIDKTNLVTKETGVAPDAEKLAALEKIAKSN